MDKLLTLMIMVFLHCVADYWLQGILAKMKQKTWWKDKEPKELCAKDYRAALAAHSFEWAFMIQLPILYDIYYKCWGFEPFCIRAVSVYVGMLILNTVVHCIIDSAKANKHSINLITDQLLHLVQIAVTWGVYVLVIRGYWEWSTRWW